MTVQDTHGTIYTVANHVAFWREGFKNYRHEFTLEAQGRTADRYFFLEKDSSVLEVRDLEYLGFTVIQETKSWADWADYAETTKEHLRREYVR